MLNCQKIRFNLRYLMLNNWITSMSVVGDFRCCYMIQKDASQHYSYKLSRTVALFRPPVRSNGRTYKMLVMFFFRHAFSEFPRPIALKLCHLIEICVYFIMQVQKLGGHSPKKSGAKNMQNFGRFWTTSDVDREYLQNRPTLQTSNSSCVRWKKSGELWSTNGLEFHVSLDLLKCTDRKLVGLVKLSPKIPGGSPPP